MLIEQDVWVDKPNGRVVYSGYKEKYSTREETQMMTAIYESLGKRVAWKNINLKKNQICIIIEETPVEGYVPKTKRPRKRK